MSAASYKYPIAIGGLLVLIGAAFSFIYTINLLYNGLETQGTVVGYKVSQSSNRDGSSPTKMYAPQVNFKSLDGRSISFSSSTSSNTPDYKVGEKVRVLYLPEQPQNALIKGFKSLWVLAILLSFIGAVFFHTGITEIIKARASKKIL